MRLHPENDRLLARLELFVVATADNRARFDPRPFELQVAPDGHIDPLRRDAAPFLDLLQALDAATFGPEGMPMPRWVFYDAGELPGGVVGFGCRAAALPPGLAEALQVPPRYGGIVPLSMYIAIPTLEPGVWVGHNLSSLRDRLPGDPLRGLGSLTKAVALRVFRAKAQIGATQWSSRALRVHARMGPLRLLTAWTPAHTYPASLTYRAELDDAALLRLAGDPEGSAARPAPTAWIGSDDHAAMQALQERIEAGERWCVAGPPEPAQHGQQRVPIAPCPRG